MSTQIEAIETKQLQAALHRYSLYLTRERRDAEDLAQETWVRALARDASALKRHPNPEAWLLRIARNLWTDQGRRRKVLSRILEEERRLASPTATVAAAEEGRDRIELMFGAIMKHLTKVQRVVFMLRDVYAYSAQETAERLSMSEGAVKAALHRARLALRSVRKELADDAHALPEDESWKALLRSIALAYEAGDIAAVAMLLARGVQEPAAAIGTAVVRLQRDARPQRADRQLPVDWQPQANRQSRTSRNRQEMRNMAA